jgi:trehalose 6-phosphate synthase/phosphatase
LSFPQGVELKLLALERLLDLHPEWRGQLVLVQV